MAKGQDPHAPVFEVRDAVHGFVRLTAAEVAIVNTPEFQRLRDIRQLAMGHMAYPGACHTRLEHSLGCVFVAERIFQALERREISGAQPSIRESFGLGKDSFERGRKLLRLAALLHDVGHPPFSHSGEGLLPSEDIDGKSVRIDHERMSADIIRSTSIAEAIEANFGNDGISTEEIIAVATKPSLSKHRRETAWLSFLRELLTGDLGADRIDYLLRDGLHSGQASGRFDFEKLIDSLAVCHEPDEAEGLRLALDEGGWLVAEQMVVARYMMYLTLYFHKTKRIYEKHLTAFLGDWLASRFGEPCLPRQVADYIKLSDSLVMSALLDAGHTQGAPGHRHARPFLDRSHFRLAHEVVLADNFHIPKIGGKPTGLRVPDRDRFDLLSTNIRVMFGDDRVIADTPDHIGTPANKILVLLDGQPRYLDDLSEVLRGMAARIWRGRIYCPQELRERVASECRKVLRAAPNRGEGEGGDA